MLKKNLYILGAGFYGEAMSELAQESGYKVDGFFDDDENKIGTRVMDVEVLGSIGEFIKRSQEGLNVVVAIGKNRIRRNLLEKVRSQGGATPTLIHPSAIIFNSAKIGQGVYVQPKAFVWTKVVIEDDCILSPNVVIAHHSHLEPGCLVSTNAAVGANIRVGKDSFLGMSCNITTGISFIGEHAIVGAGAVVVRNVEKNTVVAGVPARFFRIND